MRTVVVREIASLVIGLIGVVLLGMGLNQVLDIGSCASGGSYAVTRPCPEGSDGVFWLAMAGALLWILGMLVSTRIFTPGAGMILWTAGFAGGGAALLVKVLNQSSMPPDSRLGASIVAAVFLPMGLIVGIIGLVQLWLRRRGGVRTADRRRRTAPARAVNDPWLRFKSLNDLRSTGALTRAEFDALKADGPAGDRVAQIRKLAEQRASGALSTEAFEARKRSVMLGVRVDT